MGSQNVVAEPADAVAEGGIWFAVDGTGIKGIQYLSPDHAGLSGW